MTPIKRQPKGTPSGGQFAAGARPGASISLAGNETGTEKEYATNDASSVTVMLRHDQPLATRAAAARTLHPGVAETAATDPDPLVRALAHTGWDLPAHAAARLDNDPEVRALMDFISR